MPTIQVALDVPVARLFDYDAPQATEQDVGCRVLVPFGTRLKTGILWAIATEPGCDPAQLRPIQALWRDVPALSATDLALLKFCSAYYHYPLGTTVLHALPPGLRRTKGWTPPRRTGASVLAQDSDNPPLPLALNTEQLQALRGILQVTDRFRCHLLHGITGSGKTAVYLALIQALLAQGKSVLVLVPEINLTPQLEQHFQQHLPQTTLLSLHSGLGEKERVTRWLAAQEGSARVILGTRLAVFCPMPQLGLIVVDEEHETSYKQQEGLRYSARDVAIMRAQQGQIPIVLGSATPSLETWLNAQRGRYHQHSLTQRAIAGATLPRMRLIDTRRTALQQSLSTPLLEALQTQLSQGAQSLVFINRRGYAPLLRCQQCGWSCPCTHCSTRMVVHLRTNQMRCHHCGRSRPIPVHCPDCGSVQLDTLGDGTQKVEDQLRWHFPHARILRLDSDTLSSPTQWREARAAIQQRTVDILVGTQMLAKGHDFPHLTLVAALGGDQALYSTDFRAAERLFSQLMQVAGRAGRSHLAGEVLIQTEFPEHPLFDFLMRQDYDGFAQYELNQRRLSGFPPYMHQAILRAHSKRPERLETFMAQAHAKALALAPKPPLTLFDPVNALLHRRAGDYRMQLLLQSPRRQNLQEFLGLWEKTLTASTLRSVHWVLDVDPVEL